MDSCHFKSIELMSTNRQILVFHRFNTLKLLNSLLFKALTLGLLVLAIGMTSVFTLTETDVLSPLTNPSIISELNSNDVDSEIITIQSPPLMISDNFAQIAGENSYNPPTCILPSSISVQIPDRVKVGETFDVIATPSFELTQQQLDDYNESYRTEFDNARELWDAVCDVEGWASYDIIHPATYEPSGDNVSYIGDTLRNLYFPPYEIHFTHFGELSFDSGPASFQMTINEPIIYLASDLNDRENMDYLKYDHGYFKVIAGTTSVHRTVDPVIIYTTINDGIVTLSELDPNTSRTIVRWNEVDPNDQLIPYLEPNRHPSLPHITTFPTITNDTDDGLSLPQTSKQSSSTQSRVHGTVTFVNSDDNSVPVNGVKICVLDADSEQRLISFTTLTADQISYNSTAP